MYTVYYVIVKAQSPIYDSKLTQVRGRSPRTRAVYIAIKPDQINCLFHGSGGSIFLASEKKNINWIGVVLPATRQWHLRITTVVPCEHCMEAALAS